MVPALGRERGNAARRRHACPDGARRRAGRHVRLRPGVPGPDATAAATAASPRSCRGASTTSAAVEMRVGRARVHHAAAGARRRGDRPGRGRPVRRDRRPRHRLDRQAGRRPPERLRAEPVRRDPARPVPRRLRRRRAARARRGLRATRSTCGRPRNVFRAGHRIRLEISSSNFPRFDRNPNTGGPIGEERIVRRARQTVLHDGARASHLVLPVIPASGRSARSVQRGGTFRAMRLRVNQPVAMRDGVRLSADLYLPRATARSRRS